MRELLFVGAALVSLWAASLTRADVILSESFSYTDGSLVSVSGGTWVHHSPSGSSTGEVQVVSGRAFLSQTNGEDVNAQLSGAPYFATNDIVFYASFIVNFRSLPTGNNGSYFGHFKDNGTGFRDKIFVATNGAASGTFRLGLANADNSVASGLLATNLSLNTDYVVVTRYVLSNATSTLWLNPGSETDPSITATDATTTITVSAFALREATGMGSLFLDNLVVSTSFSDVISNLPPTITSQPQDQTVTEGSVVSFSVTATGTSPLTFQWQFYGTNLVGMTDSTLELFGVATNQTGPYSVMCSNLFGSTNSQTAMLTVNPKPPGPPLIVAEPLSQTVIEGSSVNLSVAVSGSEPFTYQWQFNGMDLDATNSTLVLSSVTTNQAGTYTVNITNALGFTNSQPATLTVLPGTVPALSVLTYNLKGNGATNWSTNAVQVQAIGREIIYLQPDILTLNEIPNSQTYQMTNFVAAFLPGYYLATNSATDGFIRSVIISRFPILYSKSYLHSSDLNPYGYTNSNFTRDLFQAEIAIPAFPQPIDVFVVHLKSGQSTDESAKRAAEASAVSNFFVTIFLPTNAAHPYYLAGDMNEDINSPPPSNPMSIQRLVNAATGLQLTTPVNPFTGGRLTFSIQSPNGLTKRYDYIQPCGILFSNISSSEVFRTDLLTNPAPPLLTNDDSTASDHLPVFIVFGNPYSKPFRLLSISLSDATTTLRWETVPGQPYRVETSLDLNSWQVLATNLMSTNGSLDYPVGATNTRQFFRVGKGQ